MRPLSGGTIEVFQDNVTLRGEGADKTILQGGAIVALGKGLSSPLGTPIHGAVKGVTKITVDSTAVLSVGSMIVLEAGDGPASENVQRLNIVTEVSEESVAVRHPLLFDFSGGGARIKAFYPVSTHLSGVEDLRLDHAGFW